MNLKRGEKPFDVRRRNGPDHVVYEEGGLPTQNSMTGAKMQTSRTSTIDVKEEPGAYVAIERANDATAVTFVYCRDLDPGEPPSGICCRLALRSATPIAYIDALTGFGDHVCRSIKVTNRKQPALGSQAVP